MHVVATESHLSLAVIWPLYRKRDLYARLRRIIDSKAPLSRRKRQAGKNLIHSRCWLDTTPSWVVNVSLGYLSYRILPNKRTPPNKCTLHSLIKSPVVRFHENDHSFLNNGPIFNMKPLESWERQLSHPLVYVEYMENMEILEYVILFSGAVNPIPFLLKYMAILMQICMDCGWPANIPENSWNFPPGFCWRPQ